MQNPAVDAIIIGRLWTQQGNANVFIFNFILVFCFRIQGASPYWRLYYHLCERCQLLFTSNIISPSFIILAGTLRDFESTCAVIWAWSSFWCHELIHHSFLVHNSTRYIYYLKDMVSVCCNSPNETQYCFSELDSWLFEDHQKTLPTVHRTP